MEQYNNISNSNEPNETNNIGIVKKIWQTWKTSKLPEVARLPFISWGMNNNWERNLKNDDEINEFIYSNFPMLYDLYKNVPFGVMKADIWRYCVIYKNGGLYTDLDTTCIYKIENWIPKDAQFVVSGEISTQYFCQWTFYAAPNCYILKRIIELLLIRLKNIKFFKQMVHYYTGPTFFTLGIIIAIKELLIIEGHLELSQKINSRILRNIPYMPNNNILKMFLLKHHIHILPINVFNNKYVRHHFAGSQWNYKGYIPWKLNKNNILEKMGVNNISLNI